jgi:hypothetical protein
MCLVCKVAVGNAQTVSSAGMLDVCCHLQASLADMGFSETPTDKIVKYTSGVQPDAGFVKVPSSQMAASAFAQGRRLVGAKTWHELQAVVPFGLATMAPLWFAHALHAPYSIRTMLFLLHLVRVKRLLNYFRQVSLPSVNCRPQTCVASNPDLARQSFEGTLCRLLDLCSAKRTSPSMSSSQLSQSSHSSSLRLPTGLAVSTSGSPPTTTSRLICST